MWAWLVVIVLSAGCIRDRLVECGDHLCPVGTRCTPAGCTLTPVDAPFSCPPPGTTPQFSQELVAAASRACSGYSISRDANLSVTICNRAIEIAPIDGVFVPAPGLELVAALEAHLVPEGDELIVKQRDGADYKIASYKRAVDGTWAFEADAQLVTTVDTFLGTPTRGPSRHILVGEMDGAMTEYVIADQLWSAAATFTATQLHVAELVGWADLSDDGLRLVITVSPDTISTAAYYTDRDTIDASFRPAISLGVPLPIGGETTLTADCGRIYFTTSNGLIYANRI